MTLEFDDQGKLIGVFFHDLIEEHEEQCFFDHRGKLIAVVRVQPQIV